MDAIKSVFEARPLLSSSKRESSVVHHYPPSTPDSEQPAPSRNRRIIKIVVVILLLLIINLVLFYLVIIPFTFRVSVRVQRELLFLNHVMSRVGKPEGYGLNCTSVLSVDSDGDVKLGVWHMPPSDECNQTIFNQSTIGGDRFTNAKLVVLYVHGNGGSRAARFRINTLKLASTKLQAHVVSFDYRGYGDSTGDTPPSAEGLANDTKVMYDWIRSQGVQSKQVLLWGHSLGTAVALRMLATLESDKHSPLGTVLEAPFTNLEEEISEFPPSRMFSYLPFFNSSFRQPIVTNPEFNFDSISLLGQIKCPLLIFHAQDDYVVPFRLGKKMYDTARKLQPEWIANKTAFHEFGNKGYGHNGMNKAPEMPEVVDKFVKSVQ